MISEWCRVYFTHRDAKKAGLEDQPNKLGLVGAAISELTMLQQMHNFYRPPPADATTEVASNVGLYEGGCPYFIQPVGIVEFSQAQLNSDATLRTTLLSKLQADSRHSQANFSSSSLPYAEFDLKFLAFSPVHLTLSTILGLNCPKPSSDGVLIGSKFEAVEKHFANNKHALALKIVQHNAGHLISPIFAVELCKDLFCAVDHLIAR